MGMDGYVDPKHCGDIVWLCVPGSDREECNFFYRPNGVCLRYLSCLFLSKKMCSA